MRSPPTRATSREFRGLEAQPPGFRRGRGGGGVRRTLPAASAAKAGLLGLRARSRRRVGRRLVLELLSGRTRRLARAALRVLHRRALARLVVERALPLLEGAPRLLPLRR